MGYKYILFDLDGTITEPKEGIVNSMVYALEYFGVKVENKDSLTKYIGPPLIDTFREGFGFDELKAYNAIDKYREYFGEKGIYENAEYDGIKELLDRLKKEGKVLLVATSKPWIYAEKILEYFDLAKYFSFVSGSELDGTRNDKDKVIEQALKKIIQIKQESFNNEDVIMVGDRKYDIFGAKKMGIKSIGVLYGYGNYEELNKAGADFIVQNLDELYEVLK